MLSKIYLLISVLTAVSFLSCILCLNKKLKRDGIEYTTEKDLSEDILALIKYFVMCFCPVLHLFYFYVFCFKSDDIVEKAYNVVCKNAKKKE